MGRVGEILVQGRPIDVELAGRENVVRSEVMKNVGTRAPAEYYFPGGMRHIVGNAEFVAFLKASHRVVQGNVPVDGPAAGVDPVTRAEGSRARRTGTVVMEGII